MSNFPFLLIVIVIYNIIAIIDPSWIDMEFAYVLPSQQPWAISVGDLLIVSAIGLLYIEVLKSTSTGLSSTLDHVFSMGVFIVCLLEFLMIPAMGTSTFFILMLATVFDVVAGFTVTISTARRDFSVGAQ